MPQVVSAGISTNATPPSNGGDSTLEILGSSALEKPVARSNFVSPEYFPLLDIPVTQGRVWNPDETMRGARLAVINQTMARQYWPNGDAVGRQFRFANLKAVGLYSVVSYGVATRTNEFGIRMALGARARDVVRMVLSGMFWNVGVGLLAGVLLCLVFDNVASRWVTETSRDPLILGGVTVLLLAVAVMACLAPARRAASIDPMDALRLE
jgi:hypothetical protein